MKDGEHAIGGMGRLKLEDGAVNGAPGETEGSVSNATPEAREPESQSPATSLDGIKSRSESLGTPNSTKPPTLTRKASRKIMAPEPRLYGDFPNVTAASCEAFQVIRDCLYGSKHMGSTDNDAFDCDCRDEWRK
jgi:[histone H3]-lysine36 N-trimethyltransferase